MEEGLLKGGEIRGESGLPRRRRLRKRERAREVLTHGEKYTTESFVLFLLKNATEESSYAIYAGKRLGGAVRRNRIKRIFREAIRLRPKMFFGYDFVVIPRNGSKDLTSCQLAGRFEKARLFPDVSK